MSGWRIAVIGNSHAASLWTGWKSVAGNLPGIASLTVFARPMGEGGLDGMRLNGRVLETDDAVLRERFRRSAGVDHIDLDAYDAFLLHSFGPDPGIVFRSAALLEGHRYSDALMKTYLEDFRAALVPVFQRKQRLGALCAMLAEAGCGPVYATHMPLYAETLAVPEKRALSAGPRLLPLFKDACREVMTGWHCRFLPQPVETIVSGCFTAARFAREDHKHMGAEYGVLQLQALAAALAQEPRQP